MRKIPLLAFLTLSTSLIFFGTNSAEAASAKPTAKATTAAKPTAKATTGVKAAMPNSMKSPGAGLGAGGDANGDGGTRRGFGGAFTNLTPTQKSCLQKNGFTVPTFSPRPANAPRPTFSPGANGARRGNFDFAAMQKAFTACKIA